MTQSETLFAQACQVIPGGVNSPVRAFHGVGGTPLFFSQGEGPYLIDVDQQTYIDYVGAWGAAILGHRPLSVMQTLQQAMEHGLSFGAPTCIETELATKICSLLPSIEQIRMMASGTEATMTAIRLARGYTQRELIIKFEGC